MPITQIGLFTTDASGRLTSADSRFRELALLGGPVPLGRAPWANAHADDRSKAESAWRHAIDSSRPIDIEVNVPTIDGQDTTVRFLANPLLDADGSITGYSGVVIAMPIANNPKVLIADEPTTALDVTIQAQILDLMSKLKNELGMSILFITHDLGLVQEFSDNVCVMKNGKIVEQGNTVEVFNNPSHEYTKKLLDAEPQPKLDNPVSDEPIIEINDLNVYYSIPSTNF